ncbi:BCL2 modifying factor 2 [Silurus meridionalis]|uniref:Uncharacterized protein n=1 Tax=Silurus meridionalis TaxID=175797 RepID=A0A8T0AQT8_SILME|nr:BCL2 modifying factor 2 [Silurus meridionalis]KAF7694520.1 hypothetical protein HF521_008273 [Silurus meridionalis]
MEDDEEDTPLPITSNQISIADGRRENMPLIQTTPHLWTSGFDQNAVSLRHRSLHGSTGLGFLSTPPGSADDSQRLLQYVFFPGGESGFGARVPSEEAGDGDQQDEGKGDERDEDRTSVEVQIGRKLREIGDHLQQEHMQLFLQHQRNRQVMWWRLATTLYDFLFPREFIGH